MLDIASITSYNLFSFLNIFGDDLLRATISLFAVINPIGTIPLFASITQKMQKNERDRVLKTTVITACFTNDLCSCRNANSINLWDYNI